MPARERSSGIASELAGGVTIAAMAHVLSTAERDRRAAQEIRPAPPVADPGNL